MIIDAAGERSEQGRFLNKSPGSSNAVLGLAAKPSPRVAVAMNDSNHADRALVDLEIHGIWKPAEQRSAQRSRDGGKAFRSLADSRKCFIQRDEKTGCGR
jgi:hypothetical protein